MRDDSDSIAYNISGMHGIIIIAKEHPNSENPNIITNWLSMPVRRMPLMAMSIPINKINLLLK